MLVQNFKSASDLSITERERDALIKVLGLLEREEIIFVPYDPVDRGGDRPTYTGHFNMNSWARPASCGTIACIGGTAELIGGVDFSRYYSDTEVYRLFYPGREVPDCEYESITVDQAAQALRSYLTTGAAGWSKILD